MARSTRASALRATVGALERVLPELPGEEELLHRILGPDAAVPERTTASTSARRDSGGACHPSETPCHGPEPTGGETRSR